MARPKLEGYVQKQVRIPKKINDYIVAESERLEVTQSAVLVMLLENGKALSEAIKDHPEKFLKN